MPYDPNKPGRRDVLPVSAILLAGRLQRGGLADADRAKAIKGCVNLAIELIEEVNARIPDDD